MRSRRTIIIALVGWVVVLFVVGYVASLLLGGYRPENVEQLTFRRKYGIATTVSPAAANSSERS